MKILDYGSASLDLVFSVDHISMPGETISSHKREIFPGGKGLNQAIALAKAGAEVYFAGIIGRDGQMLQDAFCDAGVRTDYLRVSSDAPTGNALIQVDLNGQNSIVLFAGTNKLHTPEAIDQAIAHFGPEDILLMQNEINLVDLVIEKAHAKGLTIALNPSPFNAALETCDLSKVGIFLLNEVEGEQLTGEREEKQILAALGKRFPDARIVLTLGEKGVLYHDRHGDLSQPAFQVTAVDSTAAGDTFTGFFLAAIVRGFATQEALRVAAMASAISVCRKGASSSIPAWDEVEKALADD
ncbi:MAG: ribokinase [Bacillota bacterium]